MSCPGFKVSDLGRHPQGLPGEESPPCSLPHLPQVPKSKFNQKGEKMQKQRKTFKQGKIRRAIKQSQETLVPPRGLQTTFGALSLSGFTDTKTPTRWKTLAAC